MKKPKKNNVPAQELDLLKLRINASDLRFKLATTLKQHMEWELQTPPKSSFLKRSCESSSHTKLELDSVAEWAEHHYAIGRFDYEELNNSAREIPTKNAENAAINVSKNGLSPTLAKRLYITFAYLLEAFVDAKKNPVGFGTPEKINVHQTAETLYVRASTFKGSKKSYNIEIIKDRIETALAMKKLFGKN